jgi:hypothetical protein
LYSKTSLNSKNLSSYSKPSPRNDDYDDDDDIIYDKNYNKGTSYNSLSKPTTNTLPLSARNKLEPQQPRTTSVSKDFIAGLGTKTKLPSKSEYLDNNEKSTW